MTTSHVLIDLLRRDQLAAGQQIVVEADPADAARVRVFAQCEYSLLASLREPARCLSRGVPLAMVEYLNFQGTSEASLTHLPEGAVDAAWIGLDHGKIWRVVDQAVTVPVPLVGVLQVAYTTRYDAWELPAEAWTLPRVAVVAMCRDALAAMTWDPDLSTQERVDALDPYADGPSGQRDTPPAGVAGYLVSDGSDPMADAAPATTDVVIRIVDYCTGDPVAGAQVYTSLGSGVTDAQGRLLLRGAKPGQRVEVRVSAQGYQDNQDDALRNDFFIV